MRPLSLSRGFEMLSCSVTAGALVVLLATATAAALPAELKSSRLPTPACAE
jgi:hypothetical protein